MELEILNPKKTLKLYGLKNEFLNLIKLFEIKSLPKINLLSGPKGIGKFTLVNHFLNFIYSKNTYNQNDLVIDEKSSFYNLFLSNSFQDVIYLQGDSPVSIKVDDIRLLKLSLAKTASKNQPRFIILDDIELFNINCLNALLKIIEEPNENNYFILINNQAKSLIKTIYSRCIETKIFLNKDNNKKIIDNLPKEFNLNLNFINNDISITPGNFIKFNLICNANSIDLENEFLKNIDLLLKLYKKSKNKSFINLCFYLLDKEIYLRLKLKNINIFLLEKIKSETIKDIENFVIYNLNQFSLMNAIANRFNYVK